MGIRQRIKKLLHPYGHFVKGDLEALSVEYQRLAVWISLGIAVLMLVTAGFTAYVAYLTYRSTAVPNDARLVISLPEIPDDLILHQDHLTDVNPQSSVEICIKNYGRMPSGQVTLNWAGGGFTPPMTERIENILGGTSKCTRMEVGCWPCRTYVNDHREIDPSLMPTGLNTLTLEVSCQYCEDRITEATYDVCIWGRGFEHSKCEELLKK